MSKHARKHSKERMMVPYGPQYRDHERILGKPRQQNSQQKRIHHAAKAKHRKTLRKASDPRKTKAPSPSKHAQSTSSGPGAYILSRTSESLSPPHLLPATCARNASTRQATQAQAHRKRAPRVNNNLEPIEKRNSWLNIHDPWCQPKSITAGITFMNNGTHRKT